MTTTAIIYCLPIGIEMGFYSTQIMYAGILHELPSFFRLTRCDRLTVNTLAYQSGFYHYLLTRVPNVNRNCSIILDGELSTAPMEMCNKYTNPSSSHIIHQLCKLFSNYKICMLFTPISCKPFVYKAQSIVDKGTKLRFYFVLELVIEAMRSQSKKTNNLHKSVNKGNYKQSCNKGRIETNHHET